MMAYKYIRRQTTPAKVGHILIGGESPIVVQSMINVDTNDIAAGVAQCERLVEAGCQLIRFTAQGVREAQALGVVHAQLRERGVSTPLSADIHFNPKAAYEAAKYVEKVRINPGNFYDPAKRFQKLEYTDVEYQAEVEALQQNFRAFVTHCLEHQVAIRIGVNHGSLSDRIMSRYGDTPMGMVESCMEYLQVCAEMRFNDVVISIKASNALVMVETVLLLVKRMEAEQMSYPLHLGVTEAGSGEDGRVKSAVGIGALLAQGIGDTIRVSLSEEPEAEIPVAKRLVELTQQLAEAPTIEMDARLEAPYRDKHIPLVLQRAEPSLCALPRDERPDILVVSSVEEALHYPGYRTILEEELVVVDDVQALHLHLPKVEETQMLVIRLTHPNIPAMLEALDAVVGQPYLLQVTSTAVAHQLPIDLGFYLGGALLRGQGRGLWLEATAVSPAELTHISFGLLQAARRRISRTEFISCPGCGRTLFDLQQTVTRVQAATKHLKGLKIGVMGCIVNGPGEMADADYGYVGSAPGKIDLYKEKVRVAKQIPTEEAVDRLVALIKEHGDWQEP